MITEKLAPTIALQLALAMRRETLTAALTTSCFGSIGDNGCLRARSRSSVIGGRSIRQVSMPHHPLASMRSNCAPTLMKRTAQKTRTNSKKQL
eukprot:5871269-Lingulodinium_polyedra.AAC.1